MSGMVSRTWVFLSVDGKMVRSRRLELPRALAHNDLNVARLPVPPRPHSWVSRAAKLGFAALGRSAPLATSCPSRKSFDALLHLSLKMRCALNLSTLLVPLWDRVYDGLAKRVKRAETIVHEPRCCPLHPCPKRRAADRRRAQSDAARGIRSSASERHHHSPGAGHL